MARELLKTYLPILIQEKATNWLDNLMARFGVGVGVGGGGGWSSKYC